jgi:hypothetical protein
MLPHRRPVLYLLPPASVAQHRCLQVLQRFLATNKRSPRIRAAIDGVLNLNASLPAAAEGGSGNGTSLPTQAPHAAPPGPPSEPIAGGKPPHQPTHQPPPTRAHQPTSERQQRDLAEAAADAAAQEERGGGALGVEILTGKKLRKAAAREVCVCVCVCVCVELTRREPGARGNSVRA